MGVRIDKWLWFARFSKTRTAAQDLCNAGHVALNGDKSFKTSRELQIGDELVILRGPMKFHIRVLAMVDKRVGAPIAQTLYENLSEPENTKPKSNAFEIRETGVGRPTKRDRRVLNKLKGKF